MYPHVRHGTLIALVCAGFAALAAGGASGPDAGPAAAVPRHPIRGEPPHAFVLRVGAIEGMVTIPARPQRRVANRYPAGAAPPLPLQDVPAVAYIEGPVAGGADSSGRALQLAQKDSMFVPSVVVVPVGGSVAFPNQDPIFHNVQSASTTKRFNLGRYPRGESKTVVFDKAGVVKVYCEVHEHMRSAVVVVENTFNAVVGPDGRFRIANVPAGRHNLVIWHSDHDPEEIEVTVPENGVARVEVTLG